MMRGQFKRVGSRVVAIGTLPLVILGAVALYHGWHDPTQISAKFLDAATNRAPETESFDGSEIDYVLARVAHRRPTGDRYIAVRPNTLKLCDHPADDKCNGREYLVPDDVVLVSEVRGGYAHVNYVASDGISNEGWVETARLDHMTPDVGASADWAGRWQTDTKDVLISSTAEADTVIARGFGTYGTDDPERVKRGTMSQGRFVAKFPIRDNHAAFAIGYPDEKGPGLVFKDSEGFLQKTVPYNAGPKFLCRLRLRRFGHYLVVDDNNLCGGYNFSFSDVYRKMKDDRHVHNRLNGITFGDPSEQTW